MNFVLGIMAMRKVLCRAVVAGAVILASNGLLIALSNASGSPILEPAAGVLLGQYYGAGSVTQNTAKLGRTPSRKL